MSQSPARLRDEERIAMDFLQFLIIMNECCGVGGGWEWWMVGRGEESIYAYSMIWTAVQTAERPLLLLTLEMTVAGGCYSLY